MRRMSALRCFALAGLVAGCGTAAFRHDVVVTIDDSTARLGGAPHRVSVFDRHHGCSLPYAERSAGKSAPDRPYERRYAAAEGRTLDHRDLPISVGIAFALLSFTESGYYWIDVPAEPWGEGRALAVFTPFGDASPASALPTLPIRYRTSPGESGWRVELTVEIPPG